MSVYTVLKRGKKNVEARPDTKIYELIEMLKLGCTRKEVVERFGKNYFPIPTIESGHGYDIRSKSFPNPCGKYTYTVYKIVGRRFWNGTYESYVDPD